MVMEELMLENTLVAVVEFGKYGAAGRYMW